MAIGSPRGSFTRPSPQTSKADVLPIPMRGIDGRLPVSSGDPMICPYTYNIMPDELGYRVRTGTSEWVGVLDAGQGAGVRTIIPFDGSLTDRSDDKLFAVTNEGIWDITDKGVVPPSPDVVFNDNSEEAGWGVFTSTVTDNGDTVLLYADTGSGNGLWKYSDFTTPGTFIWEQATTTTAGLTMTEVTFCMIHKQRLWLFTRDSNQAWYVDVVGGISGAFTPFFFGGKFKHGGNITGLYNWTIDGGIGLDDYLVVVSRSGDVITYQGDDPATDNWRQVATYFIGETPKGVRIGSQFGGDLHLLSRFGLAAMSDLVQGVDTKNNMANPTYAISVYIREAMKGTFNTHGWAMKYQPNEGNFIVNSPRAVNGTEIQYVRNLATDAWGFWRELPMDCSDSWQGTMFLGTPDGRVLRMDADDDEGVAINYSMLTGAVDFGSPALFKRGVLIRPDWLSSEEPVYEVKFLYDYTLNEITPPTNFPVASGALWDVANWDQAVWASDQLSPRNTITGSWGMGRMLAVAVRGKSNKPTTLLSFNVLWNVGGPT